MSGWKKVDPNTPIEPTGASTGASGWTKVDPIAEIEKAPVKPVQQGVEYAVQRKSFDWDPFAADKPRPMSDEEASTYLQMTQNLDLHPDDIGNWLEERGYVWNDTAVRELEEYRNAIRAGQPVGESIEYTSAPREILGENWKPVLDPELSDAQATIEEGMAQNPMTAPRTWLRDFLDNPEAFSGEALQARNPLATSYIWLTEVLNGGDDSQFSKENLAQKFPGMDEEALETLQDGIIGEQRRRALAQATHNVDERDINPIGRFAGNTLGGISPIDVIPIGTAASFGGRLAAGAAYNAAVDIGMQGTDMAYGAQDNFLPEQTALNAAAGAAIQGGLEGGARAVNAGYNRLTRGRTPNSDAPTPEPQQSSPEPVEESPFNYETEDGQISGEVPSFLQNPVKAKGYGSSKPRSKPKSEQGMEGQQIKESGRGQSIKGTEARVQELTSGWKNAPEFLIVNNVDDLDDNLAAAITADQGEGAQGVTLPDGRVLLMTDNISSPEMIDAVTFHEALGHVGLNTQFREGLDTLLLQMDNGNESLRADVDAWMERNPGAYEGDRARAVEEVLAEASEQGAFGDPGMMERLKVWLTQMARKAGLRKGKFSDAEVSAILRQAHERIVNGEQGIAGIPGSRYIRIWTASAADYTHPSDDFIGTGEGFQVFGMGHYGATGKGTREYYIDKFAEMASPAFPQTFDGSPMLSGWLPKDFILSKIYPRGFSSTPATREGQEMAVKIFERIINENKDNVDKANQEFERMAEELFDLHETALASDDTKNIARYDAARRGLFSAYMEVRGFADSLRDPSKRAPARVYETEIPDEGWLDFDRPLDQQPEEVQKAFEKLYLEEIGGNLKALQRDKIKIEDELRSIQNDIDELELRLIEAEEVDDVAMTSLLEDDIDKLDEMRMEVEQELEIVNEMLHNPFKEEGLTGQDLYQIGANEYFHGDEMKFIKWLNEQGVAGNAFLDGYSRNIDLDQLDKWEQDAKEAVADHYIKLEDALKRGIKQLRKNRGDPENTPTELEWYDKEIAKKEKQLDGLMDKAMQDLDDIDRQITETSSRNFVYYNPDEVKIINKTERLPGEPLDPPTDLKQNSEWRDSQAPLLYMKNSERVPGKLKLNPGKQKQRTMIGNVSGQRFKSKRAIHEVIQEAADAAPEHERVSFAEIDRRAREMDLGLDEIKEMNIGMKAEEAHAVGIFLTQKAEKVKRLADLIAKNEATDKQKGDFMEAFMEMAEVYEVFSGIANNAGRLLASFRIAKQSSGNSALRFMREDAEALMNANREDGDLGGVESLARQIHQGQTSVGKAVRERSKTSTLILETLNLPRVLMSSFDLSAPLRQGVVFAATGRFWKGFFKMFHFMGSEKAFNGLNNSIMNHPNYMLSREAGLSLTTTEGHVLNAMEEDFIGARLAKKIPGIGIGIRASERAYVGFLNKLRFDTFNQYLRDMERAGIPAEGKALKDMATFINAATGRGPLPDGSGILPDMRGAAPLLNSMFFSPRLNTSRIWLLSPWHWGTLHPFVRAKLIKNLLGFMGLATTTVGLATLNDDVDVETDPRSTDFMKIRMGTRRIDMYGGFQQFAVLYARLIMNSTKTAKGDIQEFGTGFGEGSRLEAIARFARNKSSPVASFILDWTAGQNTIGERFSVTEPFTDPPEGEEPIPLNKNAIVSRLTPIYLQDVFEAVQDDDELSALIIAPLFGIGMSNYDSVPSESPLREENNPTDPGVKEIIRISSVLDKKIIGNPGRKVNLEGDGLPSRKLTDEEYERYVQIADEYILQEVNEIISSEVYPLLTDEEKADIINEGANEARKDAREALSEELYGTEGGEQEWIKVN